MADSKTSTVIALLRGINVGGKNKIAMAELRSLAEEAGFPGAATYVQSGNVVLPSVPTKNVGKVASQLHAAIEERTGLDVPVMTRTLEEWQAIIDANPFPEAAADGTKLHVVVLDAPVGDALAGFDATPFAPEEVAAGERVVYLSLPGGMGRSKLAVALQRVGDPKSGTARNWRTVLALADMAKGA
jgi:uncharacterized protein (DUF1697 family)